MECWSSRRFYTRDYGLVSSYMGMVKVSIISFSMVISTYNPLKIITDLMNMIQKLELVSLVLFEHSNPRCGAHLLILTNVL